MPARTICPGLEAIFRPAGAVFDGLKRGEHRFRPLSMVCYYGAHYQAFVLLPDAGGWALFDDASVSLVGDGSWPAVREKCRLGRIQPSVIFFEAAAESKPRIAPGLSPAFTAASEQQLVPRRAWGSQPAVPLPPQAPALLQHTAVAQPDHWTMSGFPVANGHCHAQHALVTAPRPGAVAAAERVQLMPPGLPAGPNRLVHAPAGVPPLSMQALDNDVGEFRGHGTQVQQPWQHQQQPQPQPNAAWGPQPSASGGVHVATAETDPWTVPSREALEALLARGMPAASSKSDLPHTFASAGQPGVVGGAWRAPSLSVPVGEQAGGSIAHQLTLPHAPRSYALERPPPLDGFPPLRVGAQCSISSIPLLRTAQTQPAAWHGDDSFQPTIHSSEVSRF